VSKTSLPGFQDIFGPKAKLKLQFINRLADVANKWMFNYIETPHVEQADFLIKDQNSEIVKQTYTFKDSGSRMLALRYDLTMPLARFIEQHSAKLEFPLRRFTFGSVFRGEKPQKGRFREFTQVDFDIVGIKNFSADQEILTVFLDCLGALEVSDFEILINHRKFLEAAADYSDIKDVVGFFRIIDKYSSLKADGIANLLKSLDCNLPVDDVINLLADSEKFINFLDRKFFDKDILRQFLSLLELSPKIKFSPTIARGLDYYTGFVFETFLTVSDAKISICSGGRYDDLIKTSSGDPLPAVGGSIGLDRLLSLIEIPDVLDGILIVNFENSNLSFLRFLQKELHALNLKTELYLVSDDLKKQIKYAEAKKFRFIIFPRVGEINIFDRFTKKEEKVSDPNQMIGFFRNFLNKKTSFN